MSADHLQRIAIVGAGGNIGRYMVEALHRTGKHDITAITRFDSQSTLPEYVTSKQVDYNKPETLVEALRGQDALIITLSGYASGETEGTLVTAAGEAGVRWILPSEWSPDTANEALVDDVFVFRPKVTTRQAISELEKTSYIAVCTGFWYEYTLAMPQAFGIDFVNRHATFFDEGDTKISVSTMPQIGRAVAALLSLPINAGRNQDAACIENFKNKVVYVNSFTISQKDMLGSALRVTDTSDTEWTVTKEPSANRYKSGIEEIQEGKRTGYAKMMYTRVFYPDGCGNFEDNKGTLNRLLGLPEEDLDEATRTALERSEKSSNWVSRG